MQNFQVSHVLHVARVYACFRLVQKREMGRALDGLTKYP